MIWYFFILVVTGVYLLSLMAGNIKKVRPIEVYNGQGVKRVKFFPVWLPYLDGFYIFYIIYKHGLYIIDHFTRSVPLEDIFEVNVGPYKIYGSGDAAISRKVLHSSDPGHLSRPKIMKIFSYIPENGLLSSPYEIWHGQRKIVSRAFTFRCIQSYMETVDMQSKVLVRKIRTLLDNNCVKSKSEGLQIMESIQNTVLKISLEFIMGSITEIGDCKEAESFSRDLWEHKEVSLYRFFHPECLVPFVWQVHPKRRRADVLERQMFAFVNKVVDHYKIKTSKEKHDDDDPGKRCLVEEMIKHGATPEEIYNEIATFLVAGNDTIAATMSFILHHLACHPKYQNRCREEIDNVLGPYSGIDGDTDKYLNLDVLPQLEYLDRCILESLRITPTVPATGRELNSSLNLNEELTLRNGQIFVISPWVIHHNPKYYPQPEIFDPDRFLPEEVEKREPGSYIPFSAGQRNCIGRRLAMIVLKTLTAWILRNFQLETEDGLHDVKLIFEVSLKPERPYRTYFRMRQD